MDRRFHPDDPTTLPEIGPDSPLSGDDTSAIHEPSPKKSRRSIQKRVISVPIAEVDGSRSRGELSPPSDSWSWRKYGQKPIKGSPYPRGYYRCSSSKGCPARKQVERSRVDPTTLVITYSCDHNHTVPTSKHHHHHTHSNAATSPSPPITAAAKIPPENLAVVAKQPELEPENNNNNNGDHFSFADLAHEFGWFSDVGPTSAALLDGPAFVGPAFDDDADVAVMLSIREEDQSLFGDLDELPECSVVFRRSHVDRRVETPCCGTTG